MRYLFTFLLALLSLAGQAQNGIHLPERPKPDRLVNDLAHVLKPEQRSELEGQLQDYSSQGNYEMVLLTVDTVNGQLLKDFTWTMLNKWKIGASHQNRGVLIAVEMSTRSVFIAVTDPLQSVIHPATCMAIINRDMAPDFNHQRYYQGISKAAQALMVNLIPVSQMPEPGAGGSGHHGLRILLAILVIGAILLLYLRKRKPRS